MAGTGTPNHPPTGGSPPEGARQHVRFIEPPPIVGEILASTSSDSGVKLHMNVVDAAQQTLNQAMLDAGFTPVGEPDPPRKVRHLTLIRGGKL